MRPQRTFTARNCIGGIDMSFAGVRVGPGTRFVYDGELIEIVELHAMPGGSEVLAREVRTEKVRRIVLAELMFSERARFLSEETATFAVSNNDAPNGA